MEADFARLYHRYRPRLAAYFRSRGGIDANFADDLCQQVFLRLLESQFYAELQLGEAPAGPASIEPLLFTIARNLLRERHRGDTRRQAREAAYRQLEKGVERSPVADRAELLRLIEQLPPPQRLCVELKYMHGQSLADIAAALDCPEGTVKSRLHYGLQKLSALYQQQYHD